MHDWLQIIGAAAIVASLIFVGLELRTSRAAAQAQIADGIAEGFIDLNVAVMTDETLACIWSVGLEALNVFQIIRRVDLQYSCVVYSISTCGFTHYTKRGLRQKLDGPMSRPPRPG